MKLRMESYSTETWGLLALVAVVAMLSILHSLSAYYREQARAHDLRVRVVELRKQYHQRLADLAAAGDCDVIPLTDLRAKPESGEHARKAA